MLSRWGGVRSFQAGGGGVLGGVGTRLFPCVPFPSAWKNQEYGGPLVVARSSEGSPPGVARPRHSQQISPPSPLFSYPYEPHSSQFHITMPVHNVLPREVVTPSRCAAKTPPRQIPPPLRSAPIHTTFLPKSQNSDAKPFYQYSFVSRLAHPSIPIQNDSWPPQHPPTHLYPKPLTDVPIQIRLSLHSHPNHQTYPPHAATQVHTHPSNLIHIHPPLHTNVRVAGQPRVQPFA